MGPKRRRRRGDQVMNKRLGLRGHRGSRPFSAWSKTLTTLTTGEGHNPGTTAGAVFILPVNNWNDPLGTLSTMVAGTGSLTANRHPMHHNTAIAQGYNIAQVLSWHAKITTNFIKAANITADYIVAYTFGSSEASEVVLTAGTAARIERMEILTNPRWTKKTFQADSAHTLEKDRVIKINVPNVFKYCEVLAGGAQVQAFGNGLMSHAIRDTSSASNTPVVGLFCTIVLMTESGLALTVDSVHITIEITQKVKIMRQNLGTEDMDDGEPDVHA